MESPLGSANAIAGKHLWFVATFLEEGIQNLAAVCVAFVLLNKRIRNSEGAEETNYTTFGAESFTGAPMNQRLIMNIMEGKGFPCAKNGKIVLKHLQNGLCVMDIKPD